MKHPSFSSVTRRLSLVTRHPSPVTRHLSPVTRLLVNSFTCLLVYSSTYLLLTSCDDFFDVEPAAFIDNAEAWNDEETVNAILADAYARINHEDFSYFEGFWVYSLLNLSSASDETWPSWQQGEFGTGGKMQVIFGDTWFYIWPYDQIRNCNEIIRKTDLSDHAQKEQIKAEIRFIRAYHYFLLVKRFGGVPLIREVQEYQTENTEALEIPRSKEQEIWDFIAAEMDTIALILPQKRSADNRSRVSRYAAYALKSRAMLYAASIAKYGKTELNGLAGIDAPPEKYWEAAATAADSVIQSGTYHLYNQYPDKAENYNRLFLDKNNEEYIWTKEYRLPESGHSFDHMTTPYSFTSGYGCGLTPALEFVEAYEYIDGAPGKLPVEKEATPIQYDHPLDLFAGKDPRLFASVYLPMSKFKDGTVEIRRGMYTEATRSYKAASNLMEKTVLQGRKDSITLSGKDGIILTSDPTNTGFYQKKFYDESRKDFSENKSDQPWPLFRLAEMYLNKAEAQMELGNKKEAAEALNRVRQRAGIRVLTTDEITMERIRNERRIELAFEGHRFWDLRRWRIAAPGSDPRAGILSPLPPTALFPWIVYENGKYVFTKASGASEVQKPNKIFLQRHYYLKLKPEEINSNKKLIQNPGY
ncbi:MAG: RagB/SusD family nutrient uptake outer membrane protein [Dysgonamonadaceae bacterium]|jgi:hypothetical protein|nr:RagB/SusD family nutrient uptake outer membrane protein [Dysgonamonadaceae bacterium]